MEDGGREGFYAEGVPGSNLKSTNRIGLVQAASALAGTMFLVHGSDRFCSAVSPHDYESQHYVSGFSVTYALKPSQ
jgi:hypothetical protein